AGPRRARRATSRAARPRRRAAAPPGAPSARRADETRSAPRRTRSPSTPAAPRRAASTGGGSRGRSLAGARAGRREDVTGAAHGLHEARVLGIFFDGVANARHVHVDTAVHAAVRVVGAQRLHQLLARLDAPGSLS